MALILKPSKNNSYFQNCSKMV